MLGEIRWKDAGGNDFHACIRDGHEARFQGVMERKAERNGNVRSSMKWP